MCFFVAKYYSQRVSCSCYSKFAKCFKRLCFIEVRSCNDFEVHLALKVDWFCTSMGQVAKSESMKLVIGKVATYNNKNVVCNQNMNQRTSFDSEIRLSCGPGYIVVSPTGGLR